MGRLLFEWSFEVMGINAVEQNCWDTSLVPAQNSEY